MTIRRRFIAAVILSTLAGGIAACDEGLDVTREYPSTLGQADYLQGLPSVVPVQFDAVPASLAGRLKPLLDDIAAELSQGEPVRFAFGKVPDGRNFALRIALQPAKDLTALTLCQGRAIGRVDPPQRSLVVIAAVCDDRRRLGEVRAIRATTGTGSKLGDAAVVEAAVRKLFALPAGD